jgi:hypothetical protein
MQIRKWLVVLALAAALAACGEVPTQPDTELMAETDKIYAAFVLGDDDEVFRRMPPEFNTEQQRKMLPVLRDMVPFGSADAGRVIGWRSFAGTGGQSHQLIVRYDYTAEHLVVTTTFTRPNSSQPWKLFGFNVAFAAPEIVAAPAISALRPAPPIRPTEDAPTGARPADN